MPKKNQFREIVVDSDGQLLMSIDGNVKGAAADVAAAKEASSFRTPVRLTIPYAEKWFEANLDDGDPFGELAALIAVRPGRTRILHAPDEVLKYLAEWSEE